MQLTHAIFNNNNDLRTVSLAVSGPDEVAGDDATVRITNTF